MHFAFALPLPIPSLFYHTRGITLLNFARSRRSRNNSCAGLGRGTSRYRGSDLLRRTRVRTCMRMYTCLRVRLYYTENGNKSRSISPRSHRCHQCHGLFHSDQKDTIFGMNWFWYFEVMNILSRMEIPAGIFGRGVMECNK